MKKLFSLLFVFLPGLLIAQNVSINNDGSQPDNTAILDIKSDSKGLLIPRLTTAARTAILAPVIGLTVFDIDTYSFWVYRGDVNGGWAQLLHSFDKHWDRTGANIFTMNGGNVGIGTNSPTEKLSINATDPSINFLNGGSAKGYIQSSGNNMKMGTYFNNTTGTLILATKAADRMTIDENGLIGIGTSNPSSALTLNGTNPVLQLRNADVNKGFILLNGDDVRVGTNSTNTTGNLVFQTKLVSRMTINENGQVGIGTTSPSSVLTLNGTDPILQMRNADVDKGFVQLVGNDLRVGTNLSNNFGNCILRTKGQDRLVVNYKGQMGLNIVPDDLSTTLTIAEDENGRSGIELIHGGQRRSMYSSNGTNTYLSSATGNFHIYRNNSYHFVLHSTGDFSMGGAFTAFGYKLSVYGRVIGTEFTALPIVDWPDYVFGKNYRLRPLSEVKKFIEENNHLPGIPSAAQIAKEGIQLGDMSRRLMEKVEELTLYILQQQEQIDELKKQVQARPEK